MHKLGLYFKLAITNIKANYRLYVPYLLASTGMIMMYYIISMLSMDTGLGNASVTEMLDIGSWIIAIFAIAFILYINSFLMKRRTKEFGLYNVLGMDKPQIAGIVFIETVISLVIAVIGGIAFGTLFAKLLQLLLLRMIHYGGNLRMQFSAVPALRCLEIFGIIYFAAYLTNLKTIFLTKPVDLMSSSSAGEKAPRANWILTILGLVLTGAGYWLAQYVKSPMQAFAFFFVAVVLVMAGTVFLFTSVSVALLKMLQKNKKYYYKKHHFINVSGMMYRMKQNAVGLAQICILSCMVLVTISMTVSLYAGTEGMLTAQNPRQVTITTDVSTQEQYDDSIKKLQAVSGIDRKDEMFYVDNNVHLGLNEIGLSDESGKYGASIHVMSIDTYNKLMGSSIALKDDEVVIYAEKFQIAENTFKVKDTTYRIKDLLTNNPSEVSFDWTSFTDTPVIYIYTSDPYAFSKNLPVKQSYSGEDAGPALVMYDMFNSNASDQEQIQFVDKINHNNLEINDYVGATCRAGASQDAYKVIGSILFIGVFLGMLFLIATVLIIYYKQVSEGYEDRHRYEILQQIGLSKAEVKKTINSQVLVVFFLPLAVALLHITFAFHLVYELMTAFGLTDTMLFVKWMLITAGAFALVYAAVYLVTSRVYYHIIETKA